MNRGLLYSGILAPPKIRTPQDDEFDGRTLNSKWTRTGTPAVESYSDKVPSALYYELNTAGVISLEQSYTNSGNFNITLCGSTPIVFTSQRIGFKIIDSSGDNYVGMDAVFSSPNSIIRAHKNVSAVFTVTDTVTVNNLDYQIFLLHIQREGNNWHFYYSNNGISWTKFSTITALSFTVDKLRIDLGGLSLAVNSPLSLHFFRRDWIVVEPFGDDFADNSINTQRWTASSSTDITVTESSGRINMAADASYSGSINGASLTSVRNLDLTGKTVTLYFNSPATMLGQNGSFPSGGTVLLIYDSANSANRVSIIMDQDQFTFRRSNNGSNDDGTATSALNNEYWRLVHNSSNNTWLFYTGTGSPTQTLRRTSAAANWDPTSVKISIQTYIYGSNQVNTTSQFNEIWTDLYSQ